MSSSPAVSEHFDDLELCPNCGQLVDELNDLTGFCGACTRETKKKLELFLEKYADHIEHYISQGSNLSTAIRMVRLEIRPTCICCGGVIKRAPANSVFCRAKPECRRYSRKYVYLYRERGLSKAEALAKVLEELT